MTNTVTHYQRTTRRTIYQLAEILRAQGTISWQRDVKPLPPGIFRLNEDINTLRIDVIGGQDYIRIDCMPQSLSDRLCKWLDDALAANSESLTLHCSPSKL